MTKQNSGKLNKNEKVFKKFLVFFRLLRFFCFSKTNIIDFSYKKIMEILNIAVLIFFRADFFLETYYIINNFNLELVTRYSTILSAELYAKFIYFFIRF